MKKFISLLLAVLMIVGAMAVPGFAATTDFVDVNTDNEILVKAVDLLDYMGVAKGMSDTEFGADELVTREQFALFVYRLMKGGKDAPDNATNTTKFADLEDKTYFYAISWANAQGIINGTSETTFHPKNEITLQDAYTMIVRALDYEYEEELIYPHGYIDVAEQEGVELDRGLPSNVDYETPLTRGQMAIVLYNAFFAETAIPTVDEKVVKDGDEWYFKEITTYDRLCEKHFGVKEVKYQALATPHYTVVGEEATYDLGYDAVLFGLVYDEETETTDVPDNYYFKPADIGVEAEELDDYFLGEFTMFITTNESGDEIERVLFADCNMTKKTITELKLGTVSSNKAGSYYGDGESKLLSGKITTGAETIYAFNAPYAYAKPNYATGASDEAKYAGRNALNIETIDFTIHNNNDVDYYSVETAPLVASNVDLSDAFFTVQAEELLTDLAQVYYGGLYEADLYDVNGDGIYDYIDYKPYTFFQVDSDEDYDFDDSDYDRKIPYVYTNEATVIGVDFVDEDYVLGYIDELTNTIAIAEVIKPTVASVSRIKSSTGSIVLSDGTPVNVGSKWKLVSNFAPADVVYEDSFTDKVLEVADDSGLLDAEMLDEEEIEFYIYDGVVLHYEGIDNNLKFTENLIIPLSVNENTPEKQFNSETGERVWYIYAWVDGACKYIPVETEEAKPEVIVNKELAAEYDGKLCTYSIDADGLYTIKSLGYDVDDDKVDDDDNPIYKGLSWELDDLKTDDEDVQVYVEDSNVKLVKKAGTRFELEGATEYTNDIVLKSYTKILVLTKNEDEEYEMAEYDATSFKASAETEFATASFVLANNPDSKVKEDLVVLFATVEGEFDLKAKKDKNGQRIISLSTPGVDENGYFRTYYELFNPFTGEKEIDVAGNKYGKTSNALDALPTGTIVELKGGMVDEKGKDLDILDTSNAASLVWITEYDAADDFIAVVPATVGADACCKEDFADAIEAEEVKFYDVTKDTAVTVLKYSDAGESTTKWGKMTLGDISTIADAKKEYKCYSDKMTDTNGNLVTKYAQYLKAYISYTEADDEDDNDVADYIIIVVNKLDNSDTLLSAKEAHKDTDYHKAQ